MHKPSDQNFTNMLINPIYPDSDLYEFYHLSGLWTPVKSCIEKVTWIIQSVYFGNARDPIQMAYFDKHVCNATGRLTVVIQNFSSSKS